MASVLYTCFSMYVCRKERPGNDSYLQRLVFVDDSYWELGFVSPISYVCFTEMGIKFHMK